MPALGLVFSQQEYSSRPAGRAGAAGDRERHDHPVADPQLVGVDAGTDLDDLAHELVAHHVALLHRRHVAVEQVQVGAADRGRGDPHDRVAGVEDASGRGRRWTSTLFGPVQQLAFMPAPPPARPSDSGCAGCCGNSWRARLPPGAPSERTTSPVSMTCLNRRRSSSSCWCGLLAEVLGHRPAERAGRDVVAQGHADLGAASPGAGTNGTSPEFGTSASPTERQAIRSPGTSSVVSASHSTVTANGALACQWLVPASGHPDLVQVRHERGESAEVAPEGVDLLRWLGHGCGAFQFHARSSRRRQRTLCSSLMQELEPVPSIGKMTDASSGPRRGNRWRRPAGRRPVRRPSPCRAGERRRRPTCREVKAGGSQRRCFAST